MTKLRKKKVFRNFFYERNAIKCEIFANRFPYFAKNQVHQMNPLIIFIVLCNICTLQAYDGDTNDAVYLSLKGEHAKYFSINSKGKKQYFNFNKIL